MTISLRQAFAALTLPLLLPACGSAPKGEFDPKVEAERQARAEDTAALAAKQERFERVLTDMDKNLERYAAARLNSGAPKSDKLAEKLETWIRSYVGPEHNYVFFNQFMNAATQNEHPRNRAIALAVLGFSGRREALDPLLNALGDDNHEIVSNAVFGIGILRDPRTPPSYLARIMDNPKRNDLLRGSAAWALYEVQTAAVEPEKFAPVWEESLSVPLADAQPAVAVSALRGIGSLRDPAHAPIAERYVSHPSPKVRQAAAIAIGRIGATGSHTALIALIGPAESNPNVRLAARKALQALAGGTDRGYDVDEWHKIFERG